MCLLLLKCLYSFTLKGQLTLKSIFDFSLAWSAIHLCKMFWYEMPSFWDIHCKKLFLKKLDLLPENFLNLMLALLFRSCTFCALLSRPAMWRKHAPSYMLCWGRVPLIFTSFHTVTNMSFSLKARWALSLADRYSLWLSVAELIWILMTCWLSLHIILDVWFTTRLTAGWDGGWV